MRIDEIKTPAYVVDTKQLKKNLQILHEVEESSGAHILLAQKAFSTYAVYPLVASYISGATASGLYEARLGAEEMGKENHVFSPAYRDDEMEEIAGLCDHVIFNSFSQLHFHAAVTKKIQESRGITDGIGLRVNPELSTQDTLIYDPCAPGSRMGSTRAAFDKGMEQYPDVFKLVSGIHMHTLCEQGAEDLQKTLAALEEKFGDILSCPEITWLNLGGGHHITKPDYNRDLLISLVKRLRETYNVEVYLEPGEAVALNAGYLYTTVLDFVENAMSVAILDSSAACHMPDVLEMPYRPPLKDGFPAGEKPYTYRLSSATCLSGDVIGDYSFEQPLKIGDRLVFEDMAIYTMVKNNTFNGMKLPSIYLEKEDGEVELLREFGYEDFKQRL